MQSARAFLQVHKSAIRVEIQAFKGWKAAFKKSQKDDTNYSNRIPGKILQNKNVFIKANKDNEIMIRY